LLVVHKKDRRIIQRDTATVRTLLTDERASATALSSAKR
jgi:hypothetical protein